MTGRKGKGGASRPFFWLRKHGCYPAGSVGTYVVSMGGISWVGFDGDDTLCTGYMQSLPRTGNMPPR